MNDSSEAPDSVAAGEYWQYLRDVPAPNADRDVVEAGLIRSLEREDGVVSVEIDAAACLSEEAFIDLVSDIRAAVSEPTDCDRVRVTRNTGATRRNTPSAGDSEPPETGDPDGRPMTPLQAELMEEGTVPEPDPIGQSTTPPNAAPGAGYDDREGPDPLEGPGGLDHEDARKAEYEGDTRVFQWEIDPHDPDAETGEAHLEKEDWEFRIWWQHHPEDLAYASLRAIVSDDEDRGGDARPHAVGRAVVVNLVYDCDREGVLAVYGTTRDFRPFVDAFEEAYSNHS